MVERDDEASALGVGGPRPTWRERQRASGWNEEEARGGKGPEREGNAAWVRRTGHRRLAKHAVGQHAPHAELCLDEIVAS
jgi:hypothetical protein